MLQKWIAPLAVAVGLASPAFAADPLVTADWVQENLDNPDVRVFEVSVNPGVYERGHIAGSVNLDWHTDLVDTVKRDIVSREDFQAILRDAGVTEDTRIIIYGDTNNWFAAWGAWVFDIYGLGDQVSLLDGGRTLWEAEGLPLETAAPSYEDSSIELAERDTSLRARLSDVVAAAEGTTDAHIVDIRSAAEYEGRIFAPEGVKELSVRAGHVPGAVNVSWGELVNEDGTFKSADEIRTIYQEAGVDGSKPVITYCRIGERSSHSWFALKHILGWEARNYDGSWTEYGNAVGVPIVNVAGTVWTGQ